MTSQHPGLLIFFIFIFLLSALYFIRCTRDCVWGVFFSFSPIVVLLKNKTTIFTIKPLQLQNVDSDYS